MPDALRKRESGDRRKGGVARSGVLVARELMDGEISAEIGVELG